MKIRIKVLLIFLICFCKIYGQNEIYFYNHIDQTPNPILTISYVDYYYTVIFNVDSIINLTTNNGTLQKDTTQTSLNWYWCKSEKIGKNKITLEYYDSISQTIKIVEKDIIIKEKPEIEITYDKELFIKKNIVRVILENKNTKENITQSFFSSFTTLEIKRENKIIYNDIISQFENPIDIGRKLKLKKGDVFHITLMLFEKNVNQYIDTFEIEIKIE